MKIYLLSFIRKIQKNQQTETSCHTSQNDQIKTMHTNSDHTAKTPMCSRMWRKLQSYILLVKV